ncbi:ABC transporter substrate-binding protein [Amnibacterium endophyticum]|uniref:ABC transporter substrate-binding protein n=1 Tax=Amnibacterium endophyticum TaxID=2109337 RepID=A0ABW4LHK5_9MICO
MNRSIRATTSMLAVATTAVLALAGCSAATTSESGAPAQDAVVRLAATSPMSWAQPHVVANEGGWEEAGIDLEQTEFATGREALQALLGGGADIAEVSASNVVSAAYAGNDVVVLGRGGTWGSWNVLADADSGIEEAGDLVGKRVGVTTGTSSEIALTSFLTENGVDVKSVELVNISPADMTSALASGSVDAVNPWQPNATKTIEELGDDVVALPYDYTQNYLIGTTRAYLDENPDTVERFLEAYGSADATLTEDPGKAAAAVAEAAQIDEQTLRTVWEDYTFKTAPADEAVVDEMKDVAALLTENGSVSGDVPDFASMFHTW